MKFEQLSVRCFKCGCFGHRGVQCENFLSDIRSTNPSVGMLEKCWICGCLGHIAVECKQKTVTCFSCGERGHKQEDCTSPMANCWNCGKSGHIKKGCPLKKNVGMCFYCHQVGHHSKDCDKKVCYICSSKDHLWTRCPLKKFRGGFQSRSGGQLWRMRHLPQGQEHPKVFQAQFSDPLLLENRYYQQFVQQQQHRRCIRPKSDLLPLSVAQERTPMPVRRKSEPVFHSAPSGRPQQEQRRSLDELDLVLNPSSLRSFSPEYGLGCDIDQKRFDRRLDMADIFRRTDESLLKVGESEWDSGQNLNGRRKSYSTDLLKSTSPVWSEIAPEAESGGQTWGTSFDVWKTWNNGLHAELTNPEGSFANKHNLERSGSDGFRVETGSNEGGEGKICSQQKLQPAQEIQNSGVLDVSGVDMTPPGATSTSARGSLSSHLSESTESSGTQEDVNHWTDEVLGLEVNEMTSKTAESGKTESIGETQESDPQEELKRVRGQLVVAKAKLVEKEEQLDKTQRMVQDLKNVMYLESVVKKKFCQEEHSTTRGDVGIRCANCIESLKKLEACNECVM